LVSVLQLNIQIKLMNGIADIYLLLTSLEAHIPNLIHKFINFDFKFKIISEYGKLKKTALIFSILTNYFKIALIRIYHTLDFVLFYYYLFSNIYV